MKEACVLWLVAGLHFKSSFLCSFAETSFCFVNSWETHLSKHTQDVNFNLYSITYFFYALFFFCQTRLSLIRAFKWTVLPSINKVILIVACTCKCWALGRNKSHLWSVFLFSLKLAKKKKKNKLCLLPSMTKCAYCISIIYPWLTLWCIWKIRCNSPYPYKVMCVASG